MDLHQIIRPEEKRQMSSAPSAIPRRELIGAVYIHSFGGWCSPAAPTRRYF